MAFVHVLVLLCVIASIVDAGTRRKCRRCRKRNGGCGVSEQEIGEDCSYDVCEAYGNDQARCEAITGYSTVVDCCEWDEDIGCQAKLTTYYPNVIGCDHISGFTVCDVEVSPTETLCTSKTGVMYSSSAENCCSHYGNSCGQADINCCDCRVLEASGLFDTPCYDADEDKFVGEECSDEDFDENLNPDAHFCCGYIEPVVNCQEAVTFNVYTCNLYTFICNPYAFHEDFASGIIPEPDGADDQIVININANDSNLCGNTLQPSDIGVLECVDGSFTIGTLDEYFVITIPQDNERSSGPIEKCESYSDIFEPEDEDSCQWACEWGTDIGLVPTESPTAFPSISQEPSSTPTPPTAGGGVVKRKQKKAHKNKFKMGRKKKHGGSGA